MDSVDILMVSYFGVEKCDLFYILKSLFNQLVFGVEQTFLPFRVGRADAPVKGGEEDEAGGMVRRRHELGHVFHLSFSQGFVEARLNLGFQRHEFSGGAETLDSIHFLMLEEIDFGNCVHLK